MNAIRGPAAKQVGLPASQAIAALCPECGLCCDGSLFADVEVGRGTTPKRLRELGLTPLAKGRSSCLPQPCPALEGRLCTVYADRPRRCRQFECAVLDSVIQGTRTPEEATRLIVSMRHDAGALRALLRKLGDRDAHRPLAHRCTTMLSRPIDLASDDADLRGELLVAHGRFQERAAREFLDLRASVKRPKSAQPARPTR